MWKVPSRAHRLREAPLDERSVEGDELGLNTMEEVNNTGSSTYQVINLVVSMSDLRSYIKDVSELRHVAHDSLPTPFSSLGMFSASHVTISLKPGI